MTTLAPNSPFAQRYFLPEGYRARVRNQTLDAPESAATYWTPQRIADAAKYQTHVYRLAAKLIVQRGLRSVLDVGCGPGTKLGTIIAPVCRDIEGIDQESGVRAARACGAPGRYTAADLEQPAIAPWRKFDLIISADVIEHLVDPDPMLRMIRSFSHDRTVIVLSTPERHRLRGRDCNSSDKPEHVREWSRNEFLRFLHSRGLRVTASRLYPQDDSPLGAGALTELKFRLRIGRRSPWCCQAAVCRDTGPDQVPPEGLEPSTR